MGDGKFVYWGIAKSVIGNEIFSCVFSKSVYAHSGDRVSCLDENGEAKVGDIIYADQDFEGRQILNELVNPLGAYKVVTLWVRTDFTEEEEEAE